MSLLDNLGIQGMNGLLGQSHVSMSQNQNQLWNQAQYSGQMGQSLAQQQLGQYNQMLGARQQTKWKFNGVDCSTREMADMIWSNDCAEKTHFLLKYE